MHKKIPLRILCIIMFLNIWITKAYFDWNINIDKKNIDINETINLNISIKTDIWWNIEISEIKWLDNFDIIWQSQSQSSSTQVEIINWKSETKTFISHILELTLRPKSKWDFEIWPASIKNWNNEIVTNSIKVKVSWDKIFIQPNQNINNIQNITPKNNDNYNEIKIKKEDYTPYFLVLIMIILSFIIYYIIKKNNELIEENKVPEEKVDFEEKEINTLEYPEINDEKFIEKVDNILKMKISKLLKINIKNETYYEIMLKYDLKDKKEILEKIIPLFNKLKYSNILVSKQEILDLLKQF